ncbi:MAG: CCA tRNA nucleotidyltransferase [Candidatus Omnitrophica bacterium]|nr:CCA tRNA nucleotidyltransferase [Candidatus Omnitrophota bacterium]
MKNYLLNLDQKSLQTIREIGEEAERKKRSAYIVGGVVRDIILKRKNLDLDIVVIANAIGLARDLAKKWNGKVTTYKEFGTASLETSEGFRIDFATARRECYAHSGALPHVQPGNLSEDLLRRDFTMNAMAIAINPDCFGQLIDGLGSLTDLQKGVIKVLYDQSFMDDPTRILRAVRFEQRFSFKMEERTLSLLKAALQKKAFLNVKPPRYFDEFKNILHEEDPIKCLKRLHQLGGLGFLNPRFKAHLQDLNLLHQRIQETRKHLFYRQKDWWLIYFMGLMANADCRVVDRVLTKFSFTKNERVGIQQSLKANEVIKKLSVRQLRPSQVYQALRYLTGEMILYLRVMTSTRIVHRRIDQFLIHSRYVKLYINGEALKQMGIVSGSSMGKILEDILCLKIDGKISTRQEELRAASACLGKFSGSIC